MSQFSKTTLFYSIMRIYSNFIYRRWFNNNIEINGIGYIPEGEPVIFAPNHQNAFIDAMALLSSSPQPVVFWVRADLFNNKIIGAIMRSLKMMPAYRLRNGYSNLKKNEESIQFSNDVLINKQFLCLMPEGGQDEKRRLRPLVKGIFRSAFSAQELMKEHGSEVKIIPTGIDYGSYDKSGGHLIVNFGKPIRVKEYMQQHEENAPVALNTIKEDLSNRLKPLMLNISSEEYYNTFYTTAYLYNAEMLEEMDAPDNETNRLVARQKIVSFLEQAEQKEECQSLLIDLKKECSLWDQKHPETAFSAKMEEFDGFDVNLLVDILYCIITIPLLIYAILANGIGFLPCKLLGKKVRGTGFESSVKFGAAGIIFPILYIIETIIFGTCVSPDLLTTVVFFLTLPFSFFFMMRYRWKFSRIVERLKNCFHKPSEPTRIREIVEQIRNIIQK